MKILILMCFMSACYVFGDDCENGEVQILKRKPRLEMRCVKGQWIKKERRGAAGQPDAPPCQDDPAMAASGTCEADRAECLQFSEKGAKMDKDCPGTCESCDDCKCQDSHKWHQFCSYWAQYCQSPGVLGNWMTTNCRKTCGFCRCRCCSYQGKQHKLGAEILLPEKCSKLICKESLLGGQSPLLPGAAVHAVSHPEELTLEFVAVQDGSDCCLLPGDAVSGDGELKNGSMVAEGWKGKLNVEGRTLTVSCCHGILGVPLQGQDFCTWTDWFNRDGPSWTGDFEVYNKNQTFNGFSGCNFKQIEMRVVGTTAIYTTEAEVLAGNGALKGNGDIVHVTNEGMYCQWTDCKGCPANGEQPDGTCFDYEVRFCCLI